MKPSRLSALLVLAGLWTAAPVLAQEAGAPQELAGSAGEAAMSECLANAAKGNGRARACIGKIFDACPGNTGSTLEMVTCITEETDFWDARLNAVYKDLLAAYRQQDEDFGDDYDMESRLREVQRGWIKWRDLKCKFAYDEYRGGTMGRITGADCIMTLTAERVLELEDLLEGTTL